MFKMNSKITLSLFVIICFTVQVSYSRQIGTECVPTTSNFHIELKHLSYLITKSSWHANCFRTTLQTVINDINSDNCSTAILNYVAEEMSKISAESDIPIEEVERCFQDINDVWEEIWDKMEFETTKCRQGSKDVLVRLYAELKKVWEKTTNHENTVDSRYKQCYNDFGESADDYDLLFKCLNDLLVQSTTEAKSIINDNENIPKQFENLADDVTDKFEECCIQLHPSWNVLADSVLDTFQKCVNKKIN